MNIPVHNVSGSYQPHNRKPVTTFQSYFGDIIPVQIAPLNTDGRMGKHLELETKIETAKVPKEWNWRFRNAHISIAPDQELCGCCWAMSLATVLSDKFVASGILNYNPRLSTTYIMRCFPQMGCKGGNPAFVAKKLVTDGIKSQNCVSYDWCLTDDFCIGNKLYPEGTGYQLGDYLNTLANAGTCECDRGSGKHRKYYAKDVRYIVMNSDPNNPDKNGITADHLQNTVKYHIMHHGPVVACMHVFESFMTGNFEMTHDIYFDDKPYPYFNGDNSDPSKFMGDHAISIIGWGHDIINGKEIPYWLCRNSWGIEWGKAGNWKHAMYPYNQKASFERAIVVNKTDLSGGIVLFKAREFVDLDAVPIAFGKQLKQWHIFLIVGLISIIILTLTVFFIWFNTKIRKQ